MKTPSKIFRLIIASLLLCLIVFILPGCSKPAATSNDPVTNDQLVQGFVHPPDSVKPWCYWYWISDNVSKEGITKDLEAMSRVGIGEAMIGNIGLPEMSYGKVKILSEDWWQLIEHAIREAKRLNMNIGLFNSPGWSQSGGPWVKDNEAMRFMVSSEIKIEGGKKISRKLVQPKSIFQDLKVLAYPVPADDDLTISKLNPKITTTPALANAKLLADGDTGTVCLFNKAGEVKSITIDLETKDAFTARSLVLYPAKLPFAADVELQSLKDDKFQSIKTFRFDRSNPAVNVGPDPYGPVAISLPESNSKIFRLILSNFNSSNFLNESKSKGLNAGLAEISLSSSPRLERYVEKQLAKMHQDPFPLWKEYQWPAQAESGTKEMNIDPTKVVDISSFMSSDGTLNWDAPAGNWVIMRIGLTPTGTKNSPAAPYATGWEVDKMNKKHLQNHFDSFIGQLLKRMPASERTSLKHVVMDSYEQGSENWTEGYAEEFTKTYGYSPIPWLPVLTGRLVGSADQSNRFLWDMRRLIANKVAYDYVGGLREMSEKNGLRVWLENYGHWGFPSEFLIYGSQSSDIGGEFWNEGSLGNIECRAASSCAHVYGKRRVSAESYTAAGLDYQRFPGMLKKRGDWSYTEGINHVVLHVYIEQAYEDKNPGIDAPFGTEFNRKNTWFEQAKKWIDYQRRCMFMLQRGNVVNDVCYFISDDAPKMTGVRNPELPKGYTFDYINGEAILNRLSVKDGKLILPDGMSYHMMVLPPLETMRPEILTKIKQLISDGANVFGPAPTHSPSLKNFPAADNEIKQLAAEIWGKVDGKEIKSAKYGKGMIFNGSELKSALIEAGIQPDISMPDSTPILYIHRKFRDSEIYFITNQTNKRLNINPSFRTSGKAPELWDAVNSSMRNFPAFVQKDGATSVPIRLEPFESAFIVFRTEGKASSDKMEANYPEMKTLVKIESPWEVVFDPAKRGPEKPVVMTSLLDWSKNSNEKIKYYSGTAVYKNSFKLAELPKGEKLFLNIGKASVMAEIRVNGHPAGGLWTAPWHLDITNYLNPGENKIEIEVVNNWVNRLIGDSKLPEKDRKTWTNVNTQKPNSPLQESGLLGPVSIESIKY